MNEKVSMPDAAMLERIRIYGDMMDNDVSGIALDIVEDKIRDDFSAYFTTAETISRAFSRYMRTPNTDHVYSMRLSSNLSVRVWMDISLNETGEPYVMDAGVVSVLGDDNILMKRVLDSELGRRAIVLQAMENLQTFRCYNAILDNNCNDLECVAKLAREFSIVYHGDEDWLFRNWTDM